MISVLIVDDQALVRAGFEVLVDSADDLTVVGTAADGAEAVDIAGCYEGEIHLLATDVVMPHMLGREVAEKVLELRPNTEVLYMSGYAQPVLASRGRLDQDVHLLEKPFSSCAMTAKVGHILNGHGN